MPLTLRAFRPRAKPQTAVSRFKRAQFFVTSISPGSSIQIGGIISGPGIKPGSQIINQLSGTPGGVGHYSCFSGIGNVSTPETITETYGVLTVGAVNSGTVALGQEVGGAGVLPTTAIDGHISGSGPGSTWLVNNAQTIGAVPGDLTMTAPPLGVDLNWHNQPIIGATQNNDFFEVDPQGAFGFDFNPSFLSYMSGTAAAALGLTQASGAIDSTPGGLHLSVPQFMNNLVQNETDQFGNPVHFGSFQTNILPDQKAFAAWAQSIGGYPYQFLTSNFTTPRAGSSLPVTDPAGTWSGPGASAPTPADPGTYIPVTGATSIAAEI
jgi:hypothetical protein